VGATEVLAVFLLGVSVVYQEIDCSVIVLGLLAFGNVPTGWSGMPFAVSERCPFEQLHVALLVSPIEAL